MRTLLALAAAKKHTALVSLAAALCLALGVAGPAGAAPTAPAVTCPTVDSSTGAVTPAPEPGVDWAGCDLSGADLHTTNLSTANLAGANLNGANLSLAVLDGADLTGANLTAADLSQSRLSGTILAGATLTGVKSEYIGGTPASLPANWLLVTGYLVGPGAQLSRAIFASPDLTGADLSGANLTNAYLGGANLTGANLSDANLALIGITGADLTDANLSGANLTDASIGDATLTGATLTGATLTGAGGGGLIGTPASLPTEWTLVDGYLVGPGATLTSADLSGADLSGLDLAGVNLYGANLAGTILAGAILTGAQSGKITGIPASLPAGWTLASGYLLGPAADLSNAILSQANMSGADLDGANLDQAQLSGANLTGASLKGANLAGVTSTQVNLANANMTGADLDGAVLYQGHISHAILASANLTGADLVDASLASADLTGADLNGADLNGAGLDSANLTGAKLPSAYLGGTSLSGAKLANATLTGASGAGITGNPASMPAHWSVRGGYLIGPGSTTYLTDADLSNLNLSGADFAGMDLLRATLAHSNLTGANLAGANLAGVDFTSANLTRADLLGAKVGSAWFAGTLWADTTCPNGSKSSAHPQHRCFTPPISGFTAIRLPSAPGGLRSGFVARALACPAATLCFGGGTFTEISTSPPSETYQAVLARWQSKRWLVWPAAVPPGVTRHPQAQNAVASMSCLTARMCVAGGSYGNEPMLLRWNGKRWTAAMAPWPAVAARGGGTVTGISCPSPKACVAVGTYTGKAGEMHGLILRWSGRIWRAAAAPLPAGSHPNQSLAAVSCPSATLCFAGGWQNDTTAQSEALMLAWSGSAWKPVRVPLPSGAAAEPHAEISGVACPSVTHCVAVGSYLDAKGHAQGLLLTRSGTRWTAAQAPRAWSAAANPFISLLAISCPAISHCTVVGTYIDTAGQWLGLILTWSGKAWRAVPAPRAVYNVRAISCPTTTRCVALGDAAGSNLEFALVGS